MKRLRMILLMLLLCAGAALPAQDTLEEVSTGVITVKKPHLTPFVKIEYKLYLAHVTRVAVEVPVDIGIPGYTEIDRVPRYDSAVYPETLERIYPPKSLNFSRYFSQNLQYTYLPSDTPRADTMYVGMWIGKNGKILDVRPDTSWTGSMPDQLVAGLAGISNSLRDMTWGTGGGYRTAKRFMKPSEFVSESYYCEMFVIVSSYPLTMEQKRTGAAFAPFDFPLNSPPMDEQQRQFMEGNPRK